MLSNLAGKKTGPTGTGGSFWLVTLFISALALVIFGVYQIGEGNAGSGALMIVIALLDFALVTWLRRRRP